MKITCLQENLNLGLQIAGHLVNKNINLPILNNVLLEATENGLRLASTNLEIGISCEVRCKVEAKGAFTVEAKLLSEYVNLLPNDQVKMELKSGDLLKVSCRNRETNIKGLPADDFPVIPKINKENPYKLKIAELKQALAQVLFAVAVSDSRPEISGVLLSFNRGGNKQLLLVGTDSYRLAEKQAALEVGDNEKDVIVPLKTLQEVLRILNGYKEQEGAPESLDIYLSENQILFSVNGAEVISRLVEGNYPDYQQIIPREHKTKVVADRQEMIKAIKTAALFSKTGIFDINLVFDPAKGLTVRGANTQIGESTAELEVEYTGEVNETTLNYKYLLDGLNNLESDEVEISVVDGNVPCVLRPQGRTDYLYIIMPIKQ